MKKSIIIAIVVVIAIVVAVAAVVVINNNKEPKTEEVAKEASQEEVKEEAKQEEVNEYLFTINDKKVAVNEEMNTETFGKENSVYEVPSCAFEGMDKIYEYENFEVETYEDEGTERIYSIYFTDTKQTTSEGVCVSDSYDKMVENYGEDFQNDGDQYVYTKGDTCLEFIVENDVITSIKYVLNTPQAEQTEQE